MRSLILVKYLDILIQVCFFIIQLIDFASKIMVDLKTDLVLDLTLDALPMLTFKLTLILPIALYRCCMFTLFDRFFD